MKKNFLWLLLFVPAIFIAASSPLADNNDLGYGDVSDCSSSGNEYDPYNGELGCPYTYDFSDKVSCPVYAVDLNNETSAIETYLYTEEESPTAYVWYTTSGEIQMIPKDGYGGSGFIVTLNVRIHFDNTMTNYEDEWWTLNVTASSPPYPAPCY